MFVAVMTEIAKFLQIKMDIYGAVFSFWDFMLWTLLAALVVWVAKEMLW